MAHKRSLVNKALAVPNLFNL